MAYSKNLFISIVLVLAVAVVAVWYFLRKPRQEPLPETTAVEEQGLGAQIYESAQNPLKDDVPETNPFSADTNPFEQDTNPYKDTYKNPF